MEKGFGMFSNSYPARHLAQTLSSQYIPSSYGDFGDYHHQAPGFGDPRCNPLTAAWSSVYAAPREEWTAFGQGFPGSSPIAGQGSYDTPELTDLHPAFAEGPCAPLTRATGRPSPNAVRSKSCEWTRDTGPPVSAGGAEHHSVPTAGDSQSSGGRTRTRDKYRVVYSDHQRLLLEEEFHYSHYITIQKKAQLSLDLHLSERQVKIWFQNRRAKERKLTRRKLHASVTSPDQADPDPQPRAPATPRALC